MFLNQQYDVIVDYHNNSLLLCCIVLYACVVSFGCILADFRVPFYITVNICWKCCWIEVWLLFDTSLKLCVPVISVILPVLKYCTFPVHLRGLLPISLTMYLTSVNTLLCIFFQFIKAEPNLF